MRHSTIVSQRENVHLPAGHTLIASGIGRHSDRSPPDDLVQIPEEQDEVLRRVHRAIAPMPSPMRAIVGVDAEDAVLTDPVIALERPVDVLNAKLACLVVVGHLAT